MSVPIVTGTSFRPNVPDNVFRPLSYSEEQYRDIFRYRLSRSLTDLYDRHLVPDAATTPTSGNRDPCVTSAAHVRTDANANANANCATDNGGPRIVPGTVCTTDEYQFADVVSNNTRLVHNRPDLAQIEFQRRDSEGNCKTKEQVIGDYKQKSSPV